MTGKSQPREGISATRGSDNSAQPNDDRKSKPRHHSSVISRLNRNPTSQGVFAHNILRASLPGVWRREGEEAHP